MRTRKSTPGPRAPSAPAPLSTSPPRCAALTQLGRRCRHPAVPGDTFCSAHGGYTHTTDGAIVDRIIGVREAVNSFVTATDPRDDLYAPGPEGEVEQLYARKLATLYAALWPLIPPARGANAHAIDARRHHRLLEVLRDLLHFEFAEERAALAAEALACDAESEFEAARDAALDTGAALTFAANSITRARRTLAAEVEHFEESERAAARGEWLGDDDDGPGPG